MITKIGWGFGRCNQFCRHCYNASSMRSPSHALALLTSIADKICPTLSDINFGTGEFIVNPNALALARYIRERYQHVALAVTSNGSTIMEMDSADITSLFHDVDISLDFPSEEQHNKFRGHREAWAWSLGALRKLHVLGVPRTLVTCVTSLTTDDDIRKLINIARDYDALWRINWFRHVGRGDASLRIAAARAWDILGLVAQHSAVVTLDSIFGSIVGFPSKLCSAGRYTCRIHEDLNTSPYPFLKGATWHSGNLADPGVNLETVYHSKTFAALRNRQVPYCAECPFAARCGGGCATRAVLHNSVNEPDDYCPRIADLAIEKLQEMTLTRALVPGLVHDGYLCTTIVKPF